MPVVGAATAATVEEPFAGDDEADQSGFSVVALAHRA
jgi:hypothetical protein